MRILYAQAYMAIGKTAVSVSTLCYRSFTAAAYANVLVTAGLSDPRVSYSKPAKWAARLRHVRTDENTIVLRTPVTEAPPAVKPN
jgi:hypothetical protein